MRLITLFGMLAGVALAGPSDDALAAFGRKDFAKAFQLWEKCAQGGVASCQYDLGIMYLEGEGRPMDVGAALDWFSRSAGQGHANAQNKLGLLYFRGKVVSEDNARAMQYFMAAGRQSHPPGQANVGLMHWKGFGVPVNLVEAFAWSELSTQKLASGAKQRDEILKEMTPDQWAKGRQRAEALKKELGSPPFTVDSNLMLIAAVVVISVVIVIWWAYIYARSQKRKKNRS